MPTLLYVESSPRKERSASIAVARAYAEAWREATPGGTVDTLDVWAEDLPAFDGAALEAKYAGIGGEERTPEQQQAWDRVSAYAQRFLDADRLLIGVPMWNWGVPYRLKHLIDVVSQKDLLFTFDETGLNGVLDVPAVTVYARGLAYDADSDTPAKDWDAQKPGIDMWLRSIGVTDVTDVFVEGTFGAPDHDAEVARARELAAA